MNKTSMKATAPRRSTASNARRGEILEQAIAMFGERGFNGLTIQSLAERCEISNAGLLYYFGNKDDLLLAVLDEFDLREREIMEPLVAAAECGTGTADVTRAAVRDLFTTMVGRLAQNVTTTRFLLTLQAEATDKDHIAHDWFRERDRLAHELFTSLLSAIVTDGAATARRLQAHVYGLSLLWLRNDRSFDLSAEWNEAFDLLVRERL
ncbi:MAG: TetR/AcrR family transcriptional regulator [Novosphingobium sp.]